MKNILTSILVILCIVTFIVSPIYAQEEQEANEQTATTQLDSAAEQKTVEEELQTKVTTSPLSTIQIIISILAPLCFIALAYILIKKLKL
jgi:sensor histidine kinase regulating citrate/malate metabolism